MHDYERQLCSDRCVCTNGLLAGGKSHSAHENAYKNSLCWFGNMTAGLLLSYCHDRQNNTIPEMSQRRLIKTELRVIEECVRVQNNKTQCDTAAWVCIHPNETKPSIRKQHKTKAKQLFGLIRYYNRSKQNSALFFYLIKIKKNANQNAKRNRNSCLDLYYTQKRSKQNKKYSKATKNYWFCFTHTKSKQNSMSVWSRITQMQDQTKQDKKRKVKTTENKLFGFIL